MPALSFCRAFLVCNLPNSHNILWCDKKRLVFSTKISVKSPLFTGKSCDIINFKAEIDDYSQGV